ncbi:MAG: BMC domain-containing protein [Elusimicrobia bacterium]|nr:BMC domain-containing protein [Elusimicrobiota bacterium]
MLANIAIGMLETNSIAKGIEASDAMCKMAQVELVKVSIVARGKYIILIKGPVGEVESSLRAGANLAGKTVVDQFILRNVHQQVLDSLEKRVPVAALDAYGIIETKEAIAAVRAADAAAKAARVHLIEVKAVVGGGKGYVAMTGEVGAVRTAVGAGIAEVPEGMLVSHVVIPQPDVQLLKTVGA